MKNSIIWLISIQCIIGCGKKPEPKDYSVDIEQKPQWLSQIAKIDMHEVTRMMCQKDADCIKKNSVMFDTKEKRQKLDAAVLRNLDYAHNKGITSERIGMAVEKAADVSKKLEGISPVTLIDVSSKDVFALLTCMFVDSRYPVPSGVLQEDSCIYNLWIK